MDLMLRLCDDGRRTILKKRESLQRVMPLAEILDASEQNAVALGLDVRQAILLAVHRQNQCSQTRCPISDHDGNGLHLLLANQKKQENQVANRKKKKCNLKILYRLLAPLKSSYKLAMLQPLWQKLLSTSPLGLSVF